MNEPFAHSHEEMAYAVNLMAHPAASMMALSAVGFGLASHAVGSWIGAMSAAAEISQRFWEPAFGGVEGRAAARGASERSSSALPATRERGTPTVVELRPRRSAHAKSARVAAASQGSPVPVAEQDTARAPRKIDRPEHPDDLKAIGGIGPKLEQVLNGLGVWTYGQIALWGEPEVAWVEEILGMRGRIGRDDWIAQAARLSGGSK